MVSGNINAKKNQGLIKVSRIHPLVTVNVSIKMILYSLFGFPIASTMWWLATQHKQQFRNSIDQ